MTSANGTVHSVQRIETQASRNNLPHWTTEQAIVELLQNALDISRSTGCAYSIDHTADGGNLVITDGGPGLERRHLCWGISEKSGDDAGEYGEGLKQALLVFTREERTVVVETRHLRLTLAIERGALETDVLVYYVTDGTFYDGTRITVSGISAMDLAAAKDRFPALVHTSWLVQDHISDEPTNDKGERSVYVNGIRIGRVKATYAHHLYGEQAKGLKNRDRNVIDVALLSRLLTPHLHAYANDIVWEHLLETWDDPKRPGDTAEERCDVSYGLRSSPAAKLAFAAVHGASNVVIESYDTNDAFLTYIGYKVVKVAYNWRDYFRECATSSQVASREAALKARTEVNLTVGEMKKIAQWLAWLKTRDFPVGKYKLKVSESLKSSAGENASGLWCKDEETIWIARSQLQNRQTFVSTFLHELAHAESGDSDCTAGFERTLTEYMGRLA